MAFFIAFFFCDFPIFVCGSLARDPKGIFETRVDPITKIDKIEKVDQGEAMAQLDLPRPVVAILRNSFFDCHSNESNLRW